MSKASSNLLSVIAIAMSLIALAGQLQHAPNQANAFSISSSSAAPDVYQPTSGTNVFNYQGILRKADGTLATGIYSMTFGLYDSPAGGNNLQYTLTNDSEWHIPLVIP